MSLRLENHKFKADNETLFLTITTTNSKVKAKIKRQ
jgi:hypothetical protein